MRTSAEQWAKRVRAWGESGATGVQFAKSIGCRVSALYSWKSELARRSAKSVTAPRAERPKITLARVLRREDSPQGVLEIRVGKAVVALRRGFDPILLRQVLSALEADRP